MISFEAFQMAVIGSAISEMQYADQEKYILELERYVNDLQAYAKNVYEEYERLRERYSQLEGYVTSVEAERDELRNKLSLALEEAGMIKSQFDEALREFQDFKTQSEEWLRENERKLQAFPAMKKLLMKLLDQPERMLEEITEEQREKVLKFLGSLPE